MLPPTSACEHVCGSFLEPLHHQNTGAAIAELSESVTELLLDHLTVPELTLKAPLNSQSSYLHLLLLYIYICIYNAVKEALSISPSEERYLYPLKQPKLHALLQKEVKNTSRDLRPEALCFIIVKESQEN